MAKPQEPIEWDEDTAKDIEWDESTTADVLRPDWGDAANSGASVVQPPPGPESIAEEPYGPRENPHPVSAAQAIGHNLLAGAFKQGSDEAIGGITAGAVPTGTGAAWRQPDGSVRFLNAPGDAYRAGRDTERATLAAAAEEHPWLSAGSNMLGDLASDAALRAFGVPVTSQAYQVGSGALAGLLNSDAELTQPTPESATQAVEETALGGAAAYAIPMVGRYAFQKAGPYVARGADALSDWWGTTAAQDWLENFARERVLKASGYIQKDFARGAPKREALINGAQSLLDEPGLVGPFSSKAAIADRLEPLVEREGQKIGHFLDEADSATTGPAWLGGVADDVTLPEPVAAHPGFNPYAFIADARSGIEAPYTQNPSLKSEGRGVRRWLNDLAETANDLEAQGEPFTFRRANEYKGDLQKKVFNARGDPKANAQARNDLQRALTQSIDEQAEQFLGPERVREFQDTRRRYGTFKDAFGHAMEGANRDVGNNGLGLKDWQAAQTFAQAAERTPGLGWAAPVVALGSKVLRGRGDSFAARSADALANPRWLDEVASTNPEILGRWGQYLSAAAARSPEALSQAHNSLAETDPDYQQRMRLLGGQQE